MLLEIKINPPVATYQTPAVLNDLRRINYIFGANGTGKTTISRVVAQVEGDSHCHLTWKDNTPFDSLVYNRDFVDRNFNQNNPLKGVFTLGENQVEAEREIANFQPEIEKIGGQITSLLNQLDGDATQTGKREEMLNLEPQLRDKCWRIKQLHDGHFQVAFSGVRNSAERFKDRVVAEQRTNTAKLLPFEELKERAGTVFSRDLAKISLLEKIDGEKIIAAESHELLKKVIIGNQDVDIASLINRLGNSDWVKQGLKYHEQEPQTCPFCQQSTGEQLAISLASFFSEAYDDDVQTLKLLQINYGKACDQLLVDVQSNLEVENPFLNNELFNAEAQFLFERLKRNQDLLTVKIGEPSQKVELESISPLLLPLQDLIYEANAKTVSHNQTVENIVAERKILSSEVWAYVLNELAEDLNRYQQKKDQLSRSIQGMEEKLRDKQKQLRDIHEKIGQLEKQTTSIQPTITAINQLLIRFGFHSFRLGPADEGRHYQIIRDNGEDASQSLSEGEKTFITFLYFYYLIKGAQSPSGITTSRVVVFDDPISSLDSDILYIVSSLIKGVMEETRNKNSQIKQVFVLTHNVYFHKEISFNRKRPLEQVLSEESFWLVKKFQQGSIVERCATNPIRSAYELLWEDVVSPNLSSVSVQNSLRRILENYFTMWGGMGKDDVCALFDGRDKLICQSLFNWVNDGSHSVHDDLYINHGEQTNESYLRVFRDIFDKAGQLGHYNMMARVQPEVLVAD